MNEVVYTLLRNSRRVLQIGLEPLDYLSRVLNNKKGYPPLYLRQKVGGLYDFEPSFGEYLSYLKIFCNLKSGDNVLDIGCGCGLMALPFKPQSLPEYIYPGRYFGVDIDKEAIMWAKRNIKEDNCDFFIQKNLKDLGTGCYDVVLTKSLFTHLYSGEIRDYLKEIKEALKPGGYCIATFFLGREKYLTNPKLRFNLTGYLRPSNERLGICHKEDLIMDIIEEVGLLIDGIWLGTWNGEPNGLSFQDIIVLRREDMHPRVLISQLNQIAREGLSKL